MIFFSLLPDKTLKSNSKQFEFILYST